MEVQYPLIFFTLFLCLTSGLLGFQGWLLFSRKGSVRFHMTALIVELVSLVVGGIAAFLHLNHWERIFNGFGHITSGITQELIAVVVIVVVIAVMFVYLRRVKNGGSEVPKAVGIIALVVGVAMGFVTAHSYDMASIPAWSNITLYLFYYASEILLGATGTWAILAACSEDEGIVRKFAFFSLIAGIISLIIVVICGFYYSTIGFHDVGIAFHTTDPTAPAAVNAALAAVSSPFSGENALLYWGGAVIVGSLVPAALGFLGWKKANSVVPLSVAALICALAGGVAFRVVLYIVGVTAFVYF